MKIDLGKLIFRGKSRVSVPPLTIFSEETLRRYEGIVGEISERHSALKYQARLYSRATNCRAKAGLPTRDVERLHSLSANLQEANFPAHFEDRRQVLLTTIKGIYGSLQ